MLNTTEILIHIILERKTKKNIVINSSDNEENKRRRIRKIKNKDSIDEISQGLLIKQQQQKKCSKKNCKLFFQKQNQKNKTKTKVKVEIKTEIKPPKKEKIKAPK